jgi:PAS domain S-box-containing protein
MNSDSNNPNLTPETTNNIKFEDVFNIDDIQRLQDLFADASGVASVITLPDGTPITKPSNFCRLCKDIIRKTEKGLSNCYQSDSMLGRFSPTGAIVWPCLSAGLWDAGASITVGGTHIANWLIGQVRNDTLDEQKMIQYADEIGVDREEFFKALHEVPIMSLEQFNNVSKMAFAFAKELSEKGYHNLILKNQINERDNAIKLLQENELKYRELVDNSPDAIAIYTSGKIVFVNNECLSLMGAATPQDLIGKSVMDFIHPDYRALVFERMKNATNEGAVLPLIDEKFVRLDDSIIDVEVKAMSIRLDNQPAVQLIIRNITERKKAVKALVKLEKAINTSGEAIFLTDCEGVFSFVNPAFSSLYGYTPDEILGKATPRIIKSGVLNKSVYDYFWQSLLNGDEVKGEIINKKKDGTLIHIDGSSTPILDEENKIIGFLGIQRDITDRKLAVQELISAKEKAEESDRLKTAFLNNISHEIRTPFNGILGFLSLLQDNKLPEDERDEYIGIINQSADRLMNTINEIVEISQIQSEKTEVTLAVTSISTLTGDLLNRFGNNATKQGLKFIVKNNLPSGVEDISTDSGKLNTILSNLISNALKFTKTGSIELCISKNNDFLEFSVMDSGIGIPESQKQAIFERFIQADVSRTRQFEGLGLGLSIAKFYVEMLGGTIWLESEENKGSTFHFTLPFKG